RSASSGWGLCGRRGASKTAFPRRTVGTRVNHQRGVVEISAESPFLAPQRSPLIRPAGTFSQVEKETVNASSRPRERRWGDWQGDPHMRKPGVRHAHTKIPSLHRFAFGARNLKLLATPDVCGM